MCSDVTLSLSPLSFLLHLFLSLQVSSLSLLTFHSVLRLLSTPLLEPHLFLLFSFHLHCILYHLYLLALSLCLYYCLCSNNQSFCYSFSPHLRHHHPLLQGTESIVIVRCSIFFLFCSFFGICFCIY